MAAALAFVSPTQAYCQFPTIGLTLIEPNLDRPVVVAHAGDASGRLFIALQGGVILIHDGSRILSEPFLDIEDSVSCCGERGLLGLAFHPSYETNGYFYVNYTDNLGDTVVARYKVSAGDPNVANEFSEVVLFTMDQPFSNHNGGSLAFGPDGFLYVANGDGGSGGDPNNEAQNLQSVLGKMLRIDVDGGSPYAVPSTNPFVGSPDALDEIWAYGLRNPWRFSFDRETGDIFIGDVGQMEYEEIDFQPAGSQGGENYGWRRMEGNACFNPAANCNSGNLRLPILDYEHDVGCSVTGGYRYRGPWFAKLRGVYLYADYCTGRLWGGMNNGIAWSNQLLLDTTLRVSTFGEDEGGEIYVADLGTSANGALYRVDTIASVLQSGFESGSLAPWNPFGGAGAVVTGAAKRSGSFGLKVTGGNGFAGVFQDISGLTPGKNYEVTAWVRTPSGIGVPSVWVHDTTGANAVPLTQAPGAATYRRIQVHYHANATGKMRIHLVYDGASGTAEWDDIAVEQCDERRFDFESGAISPWRSFGGAQAHARVSAAWSGSFGSDITGGNGLAGLYHDVKGLTPGQNYQVSAWVRSPPGSGTASMWVHDTAGGNGSPLFLAPGDQTYRPIQLDYVANQTGKVRIHLAYGGSPGAVQWDDVSVDATDRREFGFESGSLTPWKVFGSTAVMATNSGARTGMFGLQESGGVGGVFHDIKGLTPGSIYRVSAWVREGSAGGGVASLWVHDTTSKNWATNSVDPGLTYQQVLVTFTAAATAKARIHLRHSGTAGAIVWDDISLSPQ